MRSIVLLAALVLLPILTAAQSTEALQVFEKAVAESRTGDHAAALEGFRNTLVIIARDHASESFFAKVHYNAGVSLYHLGRMNDSEDHLIKALEHARGRHARASHLLGLIGIETNDLALAERSLRKAAALDNRNGDAWYDLSRVYVALDEPAKARRAFDKAVKNGAVVNRKYTANRSVSTFTSYE